MSKDAKKRNVLSIEEKIKIIRSLEDGSSQARVARDRNLAKTTVSTIWQNRKKILEASYTKSHKIKKIRDPVRKNVDMALLQWFKVQRASNTPITGPLMKAKAEDLAKLMNDEQFTCSTGWLERFKVRHNINVGKISGEAADVNKQTVADWLRNVWPNIAKDYSDENIFNADETGLFYKLTPDRTLKFKGEKCVGGKQSKLRYTVLVCANMTGREKRKLLVIGKYENPRCLKNIKNLPVRYKANKRAWMVSSLFESELRLWNDQLRRKNRKILLLVDNCAAHPKLQNLSHIHLVFLPPNCTSTLQPMDQGVIRCLKAHYRRHFMLRMIKAVDSGEPFSLSLLDSFKLLAQSWEEVTPKTIRNCFQHSGLTRNEAFDEEDDIPLAQLMHVHEVLDSDHEDSDWEMPLSKWLEKYTHVTNLGNLGELDEYISVDDDVITSQLLEDADIVTEVLHPEPCTSTGQISEEEGDSDEPDTPVPSLLQAVGAIKLVTSYLQVTDGVDDEIHRASLKIENYLELFKYKKSTKQSKITDFMYK